MFTQCDVLEWLPGVFSCFFHFPFSLFCVWHSFGLQCPLITSALLWWVNTAVYTGRFWWGFTNAAIELWSDSTVRRCVHMWPKNVNHIAHTAPVAPYFNISFSCSQFFVFIFPSALLLCLVFKCDWLLRWRVIHFLSHRSCACISRQADRQTDKQVDRQIDR